MIKLLITDLDDTLYPWVDYFVPSFYAMAETTSRILDIPLTHLLEEYRIAHQRIGDVEMPHEATTMLPSVRVKLAGFSERQKQEKLAPAFEAYTTERAKRLRLHRDVSSVLKRLREMDVRLVACTESAGENGLAKLQHLEADDLFDVIYVAAGKYSLTWPKEPHKKTCLLNLRKPDPLILQHIMLDQGVLPEDCLYAGDSFTKDICMACAAGVPCVHMEHPTDSRTAAMSYQKLVAISSWTPEEAQYEEQLQAACHESGLQADHRLEHFGQIVPYILQGGVY